jgi:uncharacterized protein YukE
MGEIVIPGDAGGLGALASQLGAAGGHVGSVRGRVDSNSLQGGWTGTAAEAFRSTLHELPGELTKVEQAFDDAGRALGSFSSKLADLQQRAAWYNGQIEAAQRELETAESGKHSAESELRTAKQRSGAASDPVTKHAAQGAITAGESAVGRAAAAIEASSDRISSLRQAGSQLHDEYEDAVRACCSALEGSGQAGHHSLLGWAKQRAKDIGKLAEHGAGFVVHTAKSAVEDIADGDALEAFDKHWGDWRKVLVETNKLIGDVSIDVAVGLLVFAGAAAMLPGPGDAVAGLALGVEEDLIVGAGALETLDGGLILAGDAVDGVVMNRPQYRADLKDDVINTGVSVGGAKLTGTVIARVGKKLASLPVAQKVTGKVEKAVSSDQTLKVDQKIVVKEVNIVKDKVVEKGEDAVKSGVKSLTSPIILPPLERPLTLQVTAAPALTPS